MTLTFEQYFDKVKSIINKIDFELPWNDVKESYDAGLTPYAGAMRIVILFNLI
jgi:hypothetical protein